MAKKASKGKQDMHWNGQVNEKDIQRVNQLIKKENEIDAINLRPHSYEFHLDFDI